MGYISILKQTCKLFTLSGLLVFASASPALANNPPGPMLMLAEVASALLLVGCSLIGGYYSVSPRPDKSSSSATCCKIALVITVFLLSGTHEGWPLIITLVISGIAVVRSLKMFFLGIQQLRQAQSDSLQHAVTWRLFFAGTVLLASAIFFFGMAVAFQSSFVGTGSNYAEERRTERFKKFVTYQMAYAQLAEQETGRTRFHRPSKHEPYLWRFKYEFSEEQSFRLQVTFDDDKGKFSAFLPAMLPFFPYNYLTSAPAYRGNEAGEIRMIRMQDTLQEFPPDAPVVMRISAEEIEEMKQEILFERTGEQKNN